MTITSNYGITKLFSSKDIQVVVDNETFIIRCKTARDMIEDKTWNSILHFLIMDVAEWEKVLPLNLANSFDYLSTLVFQLGAYKQYNGFAINIRKYLQEILPGLTFDFKSKVNSMKINNLTITSEIWNYITYILKLSSGVKATQPRTFNSAEEKAFFLKQQEYELRIQQLRQKDSTNSDKESLMKMLLTIIYVFPSLSLDYLFDQTLAQIRWLHTFAAGEASYLVNAQACAAGNMKKGTKLDFFIK